MDDDSGRPDDDKTEDSVHSVDEVPGLKDSDDPRRPDEDDDPGRPDDDDSVHSDDEVSGLKDSDDPRRPDALANSEDAENPEISEEPECSSILTISDS